MKVSCPQWRKPEYRMPLPPAKDVSYIFKRNKWLVGKACMRINSLTTKCFRPLFFSSRRRPTWIGENLFLIVVGSASPNSNRSFAVTHLLWVQGPEREIQYARKTDPRQIGQQKKSWDPINLPCYPDQQTNSDPKKCDVDHSTPKVFCTEKHGRPQCVQRNLQRPKPKGRGFPGCLRSIGNAIGDNRDHKVQDRPHRSKHPWGRRKAGLV